MAQHNIIPRCAMYQTVYENSIATFGNSGESRLALDEAIWRPGGRLDFSLSSSLPPA
jgi:hypothetical protein